MKGELQRRDQVIEQASNSERGRRSALGQSGIGSVGDRGPPHANTVSPEM
jgi:hypothetical protein